MRRTKIVCTIGPASDNMNMIKKLIMSGMNVARLNFSHGTLAEHRRRIVSIRRAAREVDRNVAIMLDTKGPEIRLGELSEEPVLLKEGALVTLTTEDIIGDKDRFSVNYQDLPGDVRPGDAIMLADGLIELKVLFVAGQDISCRVVNGGEITGRKGVNVPGVEISLPVITEQDVRDIKFGIEHELDFIAVSFVRRAPDILAVRQILEENEASIDIIAKIENREAVKNLEDIINVSDGIMVARGDLGVEIPAEEVPLVQKSIIEKCNRAGKPVVTATQMLESMISNPRPTRAEASDVANAIFDGSDAIMLSGETAIGRYPLEAVETMSRIAIRSEAALQYEKIPGKRRGVSPERTVTDAISYASCATAQDLDAAAIITSTESGHTAKMVSKYRPQAPIIAVTPNAGVMRKLALTWGVQPLLAGFMKDTDEMISKSIETATRAGLIKGGDLVVITAGMPVGVRGTTNLIRIHTVGEILARGTGISPSNRGVNGVARVVRDYREALQKIEQGDILVAYDTDSDFVPAIQKAGAVITEMGGLTSHAAIVCLEFGIPVVVGVKDANRLLPDGEVVTVDGQRGLIYRGVAKVM